MSKEIVESRDKSALRKLWERLDTRLCLIVIVAYTLAAAYGEGVYRYYKHQDKTPAYNSVNMDARYKPPMTTVDGHLYILGSDNLGRDVAERLIQGSRIAFHVGIMTSLIAMPLGILLGCLGGYFGGKVDSFVVWICATMSSMPGLLFILAIAMIAGKGLLGIYLGIGLTTWVGICRNIRGEVIKHRDRAYVQAARVMGYSSLRIIFAHILPNVMHIVLITFSVRFPASVATEVFISFLGIGVQGEPSWGIMINNARVRLWQGIWWELAFVTLAIFLLVLTFNHLADALRDIYDPALRNGRKR